jgi:hypothetical protein
MPRIKPYRTGERQPQPAAGRTSSIFTLDEALRLIAQWPESWRADEDDIPYGQGLIEEFTPFLAHLIEEERLARATTRRHLNNLFLLGGELIRRINTYEEDRRLSPHRLLDDSLTVEGGPLCRHAAHGSDLRQYEATCKKLYAFRATREHAHKFR